MVGAEWQVAWLGSGRTWGCSGWCLQPHLSLLPPPCFLFPLCGAGGVGCGPLWLQGMGGLSLSLWGGYLDMVMQVGHVDDVGAPFFLVTSGGWVGAYWTL